MGHPELRLNEAGLHWDPAEVPVPEAPAIPPGADPMSVLIAAISPQRVVPVVKGVAEAHAREQQFAANLDAAKSSYQNTDGAAQQQIQGAGESAGSASAAPAGGSGGGQASQLSQMMSMPMQMASQAAQIPQQMMGMAASVPQGIAQGVQQVVQQVGQMSGSGGADTAKGGPEGGPAEESPPARESEAALPDGASAGNTGGERAPQPKPPESPDQEAAVPPARARLAEPSPETVL